MSNQIQSQDYLLMEKATTDGDIPISLYMNKITGLRIICGYIECPIVKGHLCLATEAFDDDGLPHTLEHLVFMGSEDYPYKGVLDLLANKCLASGTNASTDVDHTDYTVATAGSEGFLSLLPVYLDHLLFPTLTDSAYCTEVHHINGEGEDAGIVYCEMQARENSGDSRCQLEMLRELYPGNCGYKSETGGIMANLRNSTSNSKVRDYHKKMYNSKNLCIIVAGPVEPEEVFKAIKPIEDKVVSKGLHLKEFQRPWQTPVEPLERSVQRRIQYSSDTDDDGIVKIAFRGPKVANNYEELVAIGVLLEYLNGTSISPIQRDFVECEDPICSSTMHCLTENSTSFFHFEFESVGVKYLDEVSHKLLKLLNDIQSERENLDMERMGVIISRNIVKILASAEISPHSIVAHHAIGYFLYGSGNLSSRCNEIPILEELSKSDKHFWLNLIEKYMTGPDARYVCIIGEPSSELMKSMGDAEKARVCKQKEDLGDKLEELADKLKMAIEDNERPAPASMLNSIKFPSPDTIKFHQVERTVLPESMGLPFRLQYDSIKTNFVSVILMLDTSHCLSKSDRLYLPIMTELLAELPVERNSKIVPYEKIVAELFSDTISLDVSLGLGSGSSYSVGLASMLFTISIQSEIDKYERTVEWFHELLFKTIFTPERLKTAATRMVSDISQYKRSGGKVTSAVLNGLCYDSNSNIWATNFLRQQKFLKNFLASLKKDPESVQKKITHIRDVLIQPNNTLVHISLNKDKMDVNEAHKPWLNLFPKDRVNSVQAGHIDLTKIVKCHELYKPIEQVNSAIVGLGSIESNCMYQIIESINDPRDPDLPAVFLLIQYLTQLEGPLWRQIRGQGLSYHYSIQLSPSSGTIHLLLYKSSQVIQAYKVAKDIIQKFLDGEEAIEDNLFESAKSSLIYELIKREKNAAAKSMQSLMAHLNGLDISYNQEIIKKTSRISKSELLPVGMKYLKPLFEDPERRTTVCCHPTKLTDLCKGFETASINLSEIKLDEPFLTNVD